MVALCSAQSLLSDPSTYGKVLQVQGQVSLVKDNVTWAMTAGATIVPKQEILSGADGYAKIQVSDGSVFDIFPNSRATFRGNPGSVKELLDLWVGRVKVHIEKLNGRPNPNRIQTPTAVISVRGTIFDVAVEEEDETLVVVEEGQVAVQHALLPYSSPKLVNGGEYIRVYKNQPLAEKKFDKGNVLQNMMKAMRDIWIMQPRTGGAANPLPSPGPSSIPGGGLPGDTAGPAPPSLPPPPPPPPGF
jgi:hypothetical protein